MTKEELEEFVKKSIEVGNTRLEPIEPAKPKKLEYNDKLQMEAMLLPGFRRSISLQNATFKNILIRALGGLGDQVCAEPTLRYALETFKGWDVSLLTRNPQLFEHLKFKKVYNLSKGELAVWNDYNIFDTLVTHEHLPWEFICHVYINCVDFASLSAFRCQIPIKYKEIQLLPKSEAYVTVDTIISEELKNKEWVVIHPGKHWPSKTFPKWWWDRVLAYLVKNKVTPIIIGGHQPAMGTALEVGTVNIDPTGCIDLRCKLDLMESVALLKRSKVLLTNDSCALHMAAATNAWIGYVTLAKHPEHLTHYRHGEFGWRQENLSRGGLWEVSNVIEGVTIVDIGDENMKKWLPKPESFALWGLSRFGK